MEPNMSNIDFEYRVLRRQHSLDFQISWESDRLKVLSLHE